MRRECVDVTQWDSSCDASDSVVLVPSCRLTGRTIDIRRISGLQLSSANLADDAAAAVAEARTGSGFDALEAVLAASAVGRGKAGGRLRAGALLSGDG